MLKQIQRLLCLLYVRTYFRHITLINDSKEHVGNLLIMSHRNGAIDGFVYHSVFPNTRFLLARQLQKNAFLRFLFPGIAVFREKDRQDSKTQNSDAVRSCIRVLKMSDTSLGIFPEGSSSLGVKHLPFQKGFSKIVALALSQGTTVTVTPCSVFYDDPTHLGGQIYIVQGKNISFSEKETAENIYETVTKALENILMTYDSEQTKKLVHQSAVIADLTQKVLYPNALQRLHDKTDLLEKTNKWHQNIKGVLYKNTYVYPTHIGLSLWTFLITLPIVLPTLIINALPLLVGWCGGRFGADDTNTISLWRFLTGYPTAVLFYLVFICCTPFWGVVSLMFSIWGFHLYGAFKKHACCLINLLFNPKGLKTYRKLQNEIMFELAE